MSTVLTVRAHAKINLSLRVGPRRPDGFHELRTVYQTLALHDVLVVARRPGPFALTCSAAGVPTDSSNLVFKAARAVWRRLGRRGDPKDVSIALRKRIPIQAGLGGGSADAAAALVALNHAWAAKLPMEALNDLAAALGSDVPFFLVGGTALGLGRGEVVQPLPDAPTRPVVLVRPEAGVSTAEAYGWFDADSDGARAATSSVATSFPVVSGFPPSPDFGEARHSAERGGGSRTSAPIVNDLEPPVVRRRPSIGAARQALAEAGAIAAGMTGSGAAVFGVFETRDGARAALPRLSRPGWTAILTRTVGRAEYARRFRPERRALARRG
jgi:4-diphosphocytidyl-2-C-methyl-D-erythritol kinase